MGRGLVNTTICDEMKFVDKKEAEVLKTTQLLCLLEYKLGNVFQAVVF
jgi:hypothetical protein